MDNEDMAFWLSWCVEEYAAEKCCTDSEASALFDETGTFKYLEENAEILHTQGRSYILGCLDRFIQNNTAKSGA